MVIFKRGNATNWWATYHQGIGVDYKLALQDSGNRDADGAFIVGSIAPGVNLSLEALHQAAAALPHVDITIPQFAIGTNTVACMQSGIFWGYVGLVREICNRIKAEHLRPMKIISTGGLAPLFQHSVKLFDAFLVELSMNGLSVIHKFNKET